MAYKKEMDETTNPSVYRKAQRNALAETGKIHCGFDPYHKWENASRPDHGKPRYKDHR